MEKSFSLETVETAFYSTMEMRIHETQKHYTNVPKEWVTITGGPPTWTLLMTLAMKCVPFHAILCMYVHLFFISVKHSIERGFLSLVSQSCLILFNHLSSILSVCSRNMNLFGSNVFNALIILQIIKWSGQ